MSRFANQKVYWPAISGWRLGETLLGVRASVYVDDGVKDLHRISKGSGDELSDVARFILRLI
jgi:hypothetical protein